MTRKQHIHRTLLVLNIALALVFALVIAVCIRRINAVSMQWIADEYGYVSEEDQDKYTICSVYYNEEKDISEIYSLHTSIGKKLNDQLGEGTYKTVECWFGSQNTVISSEKASSVGVRSYYVGGDFFDIHRTNVISGGVFTDDNYYQDCAVIDKFASWQLFGSMDTAGMKFALEGREITVLGVVDVSQQNDVQAAYKATGNRPCIYIHDDFMNSTQGEASSSVKYSTYEIMMPDNIVKFGYGIIKEILHYEEDSPNMFITDSRSRFSVANIWKTRKKIADLGDSNRSIRFPYWEDAQETVFIYCGLCMDVMMIPGILMLLSIIYGVYLFVMYLIALGHRFAGYMDDRYQKKLRKAYDKAQREKKEREAKTDEC